MVPDETWVDTELARLDARLGTPRSDRFFFEPTPEFYKRLSSGMDQDLQEAVNALARHTTVKRFLHGLAPMARYLPAGYEGGGGIGPMGPITAGMYRISRAGTKEILVPFFLLGEEYALGAVLAHEMSHFFLISLGLVPADLQANEPFTDLTAVFLGFGKLMLNGKYGVTGMDSEIWLELGYLSQELTCYAFQQINKKCGVNQRESLAYLRPEAVIGMEHSTEIQQNSREET